MKSSWSDKRVTVTGGAGFLGQHLVKRLEGFGAKVFVPRQRDYNLTALDACLRCLLEHPCDVLFHAAAYYGGIGINVNEPAKLYYTNLVMGANLMEAARLAKVGKFVAIGTACSYPGYLEGELKEDDLWAGPCHASVINYGLTKKMMAVQAQAYKTPIWARLDPPDPDEPVRSGRFVQPRPVARRRGLGAEVRRGRAWRRPRPSRFGAPANRFASSSMSKTAPMRSCWPLRNTTDCAMPLNIGTGIGTTIRELVGRGLRGVGLQGQDDLEHRQARRRHSRKCWT